MKSKAFWGFVSLVAASVPTVAQAAPALNPHIMVDYHEQSLAQEVVYGTYYDGPRLRVVTDPTGAALRKSFEFPIDLSMKKESSITTSTPITDRYKIHQFGDCNSDNKITFEDLDIHRGICNSRFQAWSREVQECMKAGPALIRDLTGNEVYIYNKDGQELSRDIVLNASGKAVCRQFIGRATPVSMERQCRDVVVEQRPFLAPSAAPMAPVPLPVQGLW
jgi:hypothetical protein